MNEFSFPVTSLISREGLGYALKKTLDKNAPVVVCVGTDALIGDSLGPITGSMLSEKNLPLFVYGTLEKPVTAKEVTYIHRFLKQAHPYSKVLVIDAAVGKREEVGRIKLFDKGLKPGLGADKNLPLIGDVSIIGVVAEKSPSNRVLTTFTRLGYVYRFAKTISEAVTDYVDSLSSSALFLGVNY